jgi:hypothetical protein
MKLNPIVVPQWPKLAWVASIREGSDEIRVLCGPMVEVADDWIVEAVWAGEFTEGDFDLTDLVFGSGVRMRDGRAIFVSSGTTLDRLWRAARGNTVYVSNSLPALLAVGGIQLRIDYQQYSNDILTIARGLDSYARTIPASDAEVSVTYFHNLTYDQGLLLECPKPNTTPPFRRYEDYEAFLVGVAEGLGANAGSGRRSHRIVPLASVSSGYDSPAAAWIATYAGCRDAVTLRRSRSFWRGLDSGQRIARRLNLVCREYDNRRTQYQHEEAVWAATGRPAELNMTVFDYPEPLCLFFTGFHGGGIWGSSRLHSFDPFARADASGLGLCEFRLIKGMFHAPVPYWGARRGNELRRISQSDEMATWRIGGNYDRPIPRRILEQAGLPRKSFAVRKKNTQSEAFFLWPYSNEVRGRFEGWLGQQGVRYPPRGLLSAARWIAEMDNLIAMNVLSRFGWRERGIRKHLLRPASFLLFQWANSVLAQALHADLRCVASESTGVEINLSERDAGRTHANAGRQAQ